MEEVAAAGAEQVILLAAHAARRAAARDERPPRRRPRPRRRGARLLRSGGAARRARAVRRPLRRPLRDPARAQSVGPFDFAGVYDERSDRSTPFPSWSTAATRTPTASSSSRSSARAGNESSPWSEVRRPWCCLNSHYSHPSKGITGEQEVEVSCLRSLCKRLQGGCASDESTPPDFHLQSLMPKLPTRLVQRASEPLADAEPLTTADLRDDDLRLRQRGAGARVQRGQDHQVSLFALRESDDSRGGEHPRGARRGGRGRAAVERPGGDDDRAPGAGLGGRRGGVQRRDLRRHAPSADGSLRPAGRAGPVRAGRGLRDARGAAVGEDARWSGSSRRSIRRCAASTSPR